MIEVMRIKIYIAGLSIVLGLLSTSNVGQDHQHVNLGFGLKESATFEIPRACPTSLPSTFASIEQASFDEKPLPHSKGDEKKDGLSFGQIIRALDKLLQVP